MTEQTISTPAGDGPEGHGTADIGVTGLAVMGANLARNFARKGYTVALHNRSRGRTDQLVAEHGHEGAFVATGSLQELVDALAVPRRVLIMVKAGQPVDDVIGQLVPLLEPGDIDYCAEIRSHGDRWSGAARPSAAAAALETGSSALSFAELREQAEARAAGLSAAPVMHLDAPGWDRDALVGLLAIWAAEGTAVLSDHPRDEALQRDLAAERVGLTWS